MLYARRVGAASALSSGRFASVSGRLFPSISALKGCCRRKRSPIRRSTSGRVPSLISTMAPSGGWSTGSNMATGSNWLARWALGWPPLQSGGDVGAGDFGTIRCAARCFFPDPGQANAASVGLTRSQRAANVQGAFRVPDEARFHLEGKAAVLVDDVLTSGATINAAARALLRAGAARVDVLVFARVVTG
jgi:hypothetical protein